MTREQQKKLKLLKDSLMKIAQPYIKNFKLKKKDFAIWTERNGLFFVLSMYVTEMNGVCHCSATATVKPLWADDILWEILDMEENKRQSMSFRSVGAFALHGAEMYKEKHELRNRELSELESVVENLISNFYERIQNITLEDFGGYAEETVYHGELIKCIDLIHERKYDEARAFVSSMKSDWFVNKGYGFRDRAIKYIEEKDK